MCVKKLKGEFMKLFLREIIGSDKKELLDMVDEIKEDILEDKFEGFRNIKNLTPSNYDDFLDELIKNKNMKTFKPNLVDQTTYILVDEKGHIYGGTNIRHRLNEKLLIHGGNIGYLIRPSERKKHFGSLMLKLALEKCKLLGLNRALITCRVDNIGFMKVIENNGGVYEKSYINPNDSKAYKRYWINIK